MELLEGETSLLQAAIPSEVSGVTAQLCAVARDLAHNLSMSESMRLLKLELGTLFSFSCRGEERCRILLRNCNDISKRYFLSLGHLLRHIVTLICIQIDCKGYMWGESMWLTVSAWRRLHRRNFDFIRSLPLLLFILSSPSVPPCRAYCKFRFWFIDSLSSSRQPQTQFTCPVKVVLWLLYISEDLQASNTYQ